MSLDADLDLPGPYWCPICQQKTPWVALRRGSKRQVCGVCRSPRSVFPCRHACGHMDCRAAREYHGLR